MTTRSPDALADDLTFYPAYCHSLSPTFNVWAKLSAADVHKLKARAGYEGQSIYFHLNHPIRWVRLVGVLVAFEEHDRRWIMVLDDSSGEKIEVVCIKPRIEPARSVEQDNDKANSNAGARARVVPTNDAATIPDLTGIDLGSVVKVKGGIGEFRGTRQILLKRISIIPSTAHEIKAWAELSTFRAEILSKPWVVPEEQQKKLLQQHVSGPSETKKKKKRSSRRRHAKEEGIASRREHDVESGLSRKEEKKKEISTDGAGDDVTLQRERSPVRQHDETQPRNSVGGVYAQIQAGYRASERRRGAAVTVSSSSNTSIQGTGHQDMEPTMTTSSHTTIIRRNADQKRKDPAASSSFAAAREKARLRTDGKYDALGLGA